MSLQDDVNAQVAQIHADLSAAQATVLPETVSVTINLSAVRAAINAIAAQVVTLGGVLPVINIPDIEVELNINQIKEASEAHTAITSGMVELLIDSSNFLGLDQ